jgi:hypothetical protein
VVSDPLCESNHCLEQHELVSTLQDLALTADGVLGWERGNLFSDAPEEEQCTEDFPFFRKLAAAGIAFLTPRRDTWKLYRGPWSVKDWELQDAFKDIARCGMGSMKDQDQHKFPAFKRILDHDAWISNLALHNMVRRARRRFVDGFFDEAFCDMADAFIAGLEYSSEYDLCSEEWYEFRRLEEAVDGFCIHSQELKWYPLDWRSMDLSVMQDLPKAAIYLHFYRLKVPRKLIGTYLEFRELVEVAVSSISYDAPPFFPKFLQLPAEIREEVTHEYLPLERVAGRLSKHVHYDRFGSRCCVWEYPDVLIACDNQDSATFPPPETARAPCGWLPTLAFANKAMLGEVVEIMLRKTARIDLKYYEHVPSFKIATWLRKFIAAIPYNDKSRAVKYLCFPHMHRYNSIQPLALTNPSFELMAACFNLRKVDMTFYHEMLRVEDPPNSYQFRPRTAMELATFYQVWPIFKCANLEAIHFDGIHAPPSRGGVPADMVALDYLAKWLKKRFLIQEQKIQVEVVQRWGKWRGWQAGRLIELDKDDLEDVAWGRDFVKGEISGPADTGARCAYPPVM